MLLGFFVFAAVYEATFLGFSHTLDEYKSIMTDSIIPALNSTGSKGAQRDLAWNLVAQSSFTYNYVSSAGILDFYPTGKYEHYPCELGKHYFCILVCFTTS